VTALNVDFLSVSSRLATPGLIGAAHAAGKEVHVWTVDKPRQMARFIDLGVDNLITDMPSVARSLLDERAAMSDEKLLFIKVRSGFLR
jgi:glycerophosphoryl diester phosphodiesterase